MNSDAFDLASRPTEPGEPFEAAPSVLGDPSVLGESDRLPNVGPAEATLIGRILDRRYALTRFLGAGGVGLVYEAKHTTLDRRYAVKVLRPAVSKDGEILLRFKQEAQAAGAIGNVHIVDVVDFGIEADGTAFIAMELLDGRSLGDALGPRGMELSRAVHILAQVCEAIGAAHERGIVHRDLKPENVQLVERRGDPDFVKVLDFGVAKVMRNSEKLTQTGEVFGTPHYMAPEQCAGAPTDHRADVYALGVMLYQMVTGRLPFDGESVIAIVSRHLHEEPISPRELNPSLPIEIESVIARAMAKDPAARYPHVAELLTDLLAVPGPRRLIASGTRMRIPEHLRGVSTWRARFVAGSARKRRKLLAPFAAVSVAVLAAGLGGGYWLGTRNGDTDTAAVEEASAGPSAIARPSSATAEPLRAEPAPTAAAEADPWADPPSAAASETDPWADKPSAAASETDPWGDNPSAAARAGSTQLGATPTAVVLHTDPEDVEVWSGQVLLGRTPLALPQPTGETRMAVLLSKDGFESRELVLSGSTGEKLTVRLAKRASSDSGSAP